MKDIIYIDNKKEYATGLVKPKTVSLFFDKIYLPEDYVRFANYYELENYKEIWNVPQEVILDVEGYCDGILKNCFANNLSRSLYYHAKKNMENNLSLLEKGSLEYKKCQTFFRNMGLKYITENMKKELHINIVPIYLEENIFDFEYNFSEIVENPHPMCVICLDGIPQILEEKLEWEQIIEMRNDKKAIKKLRKLKNWCNIELLGKSKDEINSTLEEALDEYKQALNKHGILTVLGGISTVFSISETILSFINEEWNLQAGAALSIASGVTVFAIKQYLEFQDDRNKPIAYITDVYKHINKNMT